MGCGAVCGNNSSIYEPNQFSHKIVLSLIPCLKHARQFISTREYQSFVKQIHLNPLKYRLKISSKLIPKEQIDPGMLIKWKVILYCFETSNPHFNNCLGHKFKKVTQQNLKQQIQNDQNQPDSQNEYVLEEDSIIFPHKYSSQIEKDIDRTCQLPDNKKKTFQRILKRITNHFPSMGYTQGINFIIGYLLTIGFEEFDVYWMFIHIAINRRYLLLGLFEDNLPLSNIYKIVFKNILQRVNTPLYEHLYEQLQMNESEWVFKWFFTYFIYSFPHQMIKYVFDIFIEIGGLGLIKLAVAITQQLASVLMKEDDRCNVSIFFQSLKNIDVFNQYISINKVIQRAYSLQIKKQDFNGIDTNPTNFYAQFILANLQQQSSNASEATLIKVNDQSKQLKAQKKQTFSEDNDQNSIPNKLLQSWYEKLSSEREDFLLSHTQIKSQKDKINKERISIENDLHHLIIRQSQEEEIKSPQKENSVNSNKNSIKDSIEMKKESVPSTGCSLNKKGSQVNNRDDVSEIDELWEEEDRNSSVSRNMSSKISQQSRTQNGFNLKIRKTSYEDQLDKFASTHCNPLGKSKAGGNNSKISSIFTEEKLNSLKPKINNFQIPSNRNKGNHLVRVAQHILSNLSINDHSQNEQTNSQYSKFSQKQKKSKQNDIYGKDYYRKSKKQISLRHNQVQNQKDKGDKNSLQDRNSSSRDSYIDPHNSFYVSNESIQDEMKNSQVQAGSVKAFDSHRQRVSTQQDILTNSLHVSNIKENNSKYAAESNASEIEIFQAPQIFKKKNRVSSRINGAQRDVFVDPQRPSKLIHTISEADIFQKGQKSMKTIKIGIEEGSIYEESYESIFVPSEGQKSNTFRFHQQLQKCEVESVK